MSKTILTRITKSEHLLSYATVAAIAVTVAVVAFALNSNYARVANVLELDANSVSELEALKAEQCGDNPCQVSISFEPK
jgi:hypothetical protein